MLQRYPVVRGVDVRAICSASHVLPLFRLLCYRPPASRALHCASGAARLSYLTLTTFCGTATVAVLLVDGKKWMHINEVSSIGDAIFYLSRLTQRRWTEAEFAREVIRLRLPLYAVAPDGHSIVSTERVDGKLVITPRPDLKADYVTLLQDEIEQLSLGGQTITNRPAWLFEDVPYRSWGEIQAYRAANHRVVNHWDTEEGEWMGQSSIYFFDRPIGVTPDTTLVVPRHTIAELAKAKPANAPIPSAPLAPAESWPHDAGATEPKRSGPALDGSTAASTGAPGAVPDGTATRDDSATVEMDMHESPVVPKPAAARPPDEILGITKTEVVTAFAPLIPIKDLAGALADGKGIYGEGKARLTRGTKDRRHLARWDPIYLAVSYYEMYRIPKKKLDRVFTDHAFLRLWLDKWDEKSEHLP